MSCGNTYQTMPFVGTDEAANYFGVTCRTLARWRRAGFGPAFFKLGPRVIRYHIDDLDAFASETRYRPRGA